MINVAAIMVSPLWTPTAERVEKSNFTSYLQFLDKEKNLKFRSYAELHHWSVIETAPFWESLWQFFKIEASTPYRQVIGEKRPLKGVPRPEWFPGARLNFAQNLLRYRDDQIALIAIKESGERKTITYKELYQKVARCASALKKAGVKTGDRVAGYVPNCAESIVAMLAATSLGAIWSSCSPDFGVQGVLDRFQQIGPKVLFTVDGYTYNGKRHDLMARLETIIPKLSSLQKTIVIPFVGEKIPLHPPLTKGDTRGIFERGSGGDMTGATSRYLVLALMLLSLFSLHQCLDHRNETQEFSPLPATSFLLGQKIPINTADPKMLEALPGIGPKLAQRIVEDRRMNGPFKNEKELLRVPGLGPKKVEAIRSLIDF